VDGLRLGALVVGRRVRGHVGPARRALACLRASHQLLGLGVHAQRHAEARGLAHRLQEMTVVAALPAGCLDHERLHRARPRLDHALELTRVAGHRPGPQPDVAARARRDRTRSLAQRRRGGRRRVVERHVEQGGHTARQRRGRQRGEVLPLGQPLVAAVHVRIEEAREHVQPARVIQELAVEILTDGDDAAVLDPDVGDEGALLGHDRPAADDAHGGYPRAPGGGPAG